MIVSLFGIKYGDVRLRFQISYEIFSMYPEYPGCEERIRDLIDQIKLVTWTFFFFCWMKIPKGSLGSKPDCSYAIFFALQKWSRIQGIAESKWELEKDLEKRKQNHHLNSTRVKKLVTGKVSDPQLHNSWAHPQLQVILATFRWKVFDVIMALINQNTYITSNIWSIVYQLRFSPDWCNLFQVAHHAFYHYYTFFPSKFRDTAKNEYRRIKSDFSFQGNWWYSLNIARIF